MFRRKTILSKIGQLKIVDLKKEVKLLSIKVEVEFAFHRAKYTAQPRAIDPAKVELQAQV